MNGPGLIDDSGACLIAVAVSAHSIVCACVGDCRAVVGRNLLSSSSPSSSGLSVKMSNTKVLMRQLSTDQTGWENDERRRIEQMGGSVVEGRINGILEPSRTIGDADLKRVEPPSGLIAEPVITSFDPFDCWGNEFDDMCLIVATVSFLFCFCNNNPIELYLWGDSFKLMTFVIRFFSQDGLWDVIDSVEVGKLIRKYHSKGLTEFGKLLAAEAARRGSRDDITVIVVSAHEVFFVSLCFFLLHIQRETS